MQPVPDSMLTGNNNYLSASITALINSMQMVSLYKDPEGNDVFSKTTPSDDPTSDQADVQHLRVRVLELEKRLSEVCSIYITSWHVVLVFQ